jgi:Lipocalin-like domain
MTMLRAMILAAAVGPFGADVVAAQGVPQGEVAKKLVGAWRYVGTTVDGVNKPRGNNPKGMIYYGPYGEMSVQIAPDVERKRAGAVMTPDEAKVAVTDYIAYFGTYTIDEKAGTVTHHRQATIQPGDSGPFVRHYEFKGDRLILRPPNSKQEITWERIK